MHKPRSRARLEREAAHEELAHAALLGEFYPASRHLITQVQDTHAAHGRVYVSWERDWVRVHATPAPGRWRLALPTQRGERLTVEQIVAAGERRAPARVRLRDPWSEAEQAGHPVPAR